MKSMTQAVEQSSSHSHIMSTLWDGSSKINFTPQELYFYTLIYEGLPLQTLVNGSGQNIIGLRKTAKQIFDEHTSIKNIYHNWDHTENATKIAMGFASYYKLEDLDKIVLEAAMLIHDIGRLIIDKGHEKIGSNIGKLILPRFNFDQSQTYTVSGMTEATEIRLDPDTGYLTQSPGIFHPKAYTNDMSKQDNMRRQLFLQWLACDADMYNIGTHECFETSAKVKAEYDAWGEYKTENDWTKEVIFLLKSFNNRDFYTEPAKRYLGRILAQNLRITKEYMSALGSEQLIPPLYKFAEKYGEGYKRQNEIYMPKNKAVVTHIHPIHRQERTTTQAHPAV